MSAAAHDSSLIDRWTRSRDAEAFREIVERHAAMVFATARRILGDPAGAEDVAQDCFLRLATARAPSNLGAWLHRVATNRALDIARNERTRREKESRWTPPSPGTADPEWAEVEALVDRAIEALPDDLRAPVVLHFLEGRTHEAVAASLGIAKATVAYRTGKAIEAIRTFLARKGLRSVPAGLAAWLSGRPAEGAPPTLVARLGKLALAGPGSIPSPRPASRKPSAAAGAGFVEGGTMKVYVPIAIGASLAVVAVALFFALRPPPEPPPAVAIVPAAGPKTAPAEEIAREEKGGATKDMDEEKGKEAEPPAAKAPEAPPPAPAPCTVAGVVRDAEGRPVAFAEVSIAVHPKEDEHPLREGRLLPEWIRRSAFLSTKAGQDGRYRFDDVPAPGDATVTAFDEGHDGGRMSAQAKLESGAAVEVDIALEEGKTLRGVLVGRDGAPVTDAVVSAYHAWHPKDMVWGSGQAATDGKGRFRIALGKKAEMCTLRVNSDGSGQDFFFDIPVGPEEVRLQLHEPATVRGTLTWADGSPAKGVLAIVEGEVHEPNIGIWYSGWRPRLFLDGAVGEDGTYEVTGIQPGFDCNVYAIEAGLDLQKALMKPLTERARPPFRLGPGEVKEWSEMISKPIVLRGTVRTEVKGTPVERAKVIVSKDGKRLYDAWGETDKEGAFRLHLNGGPGRYRVQASTDFVEIVGEKALDGRFGKDLEIEEGQDVEVDLRLFEPVVLPFRVIDAAGKPVKTIRFELSMKGTDGRRSGHGSSMGLDEEGRGSIDIHVPLAEVKIDISSFPDGPMVEGRLLAAESGTVLPEETFTLPAVCDLSGVLVDGEGSPIPECTVRIETSCEGAKRERMTLRTDKRGVFSAKGRLRAAPGVVLDLDVDGKGKWKSEKLDTSAGTPLDLGQVKISQEATPGE